MATNNAINVNAVTPLTAVNGGSGASSPAIHTLPVAQGASAFNFLTLTNGQVLVGSTGADPVPAAITAGAGLSVTNGAGTITIAVAGSGITWTSVSGATQTLAVNNGYIANRSGANVAFTLPTTAAVGDTIRIVGVTNGPNGWSIAQNASQQISLGSVSSTTGVGGSFASTNPNDCVTIVCSVTNTGWTVMSSVGNITIV